MELKQAGPVSILYVMAAKAEYGAELQRRFVPLMTGVGPVEATLSLARALCRLEAQGKLPDLVVSLGSAGSARLSQAEVYQASSVAYRDMDASPFGFEKGRTPFLDLPATVPLDLTLPGVPTASLSTGGNVISGAAYETIEADMVEMETYAVYRVCQSFGLPLIGLRGISDGITEVAHIDDWTQYLDVIDAKLAAIIDRLEAALAEGGLAALRRPA
ncbi:5'-methylthioadenosine/S-adenosylhomocysteine nucleosidase [Xaviernesmea rhizosphaerae]|nr:5'-methylthioadenosine/S-adenosylhomocysteine nucleosidase [Xaviernesmea rhizosphaerae]